MLAKARRNAMTALRKSEKAYTAMNLVMKTPLYLSIPALTRGPFEFAFSEIQAVRDRAETCIATETVLDFGFDEANLNIRCAQGLRAEGTIRAILGQIATATESL